MGPSLEIHVEMRQVKLYPRVFMNHSFNIVYEMPHLGKSSFKLPGPFPEEEMTAR